MCRQKQTKNNNPNPPPPPKKKKKKNPAHSNDFDRSMMPDSDVTTSLTPSLPQPVIFPGWKMQGCACEHYISGPITFILNVMRFNENPFACQCEKEDKKA